MVLLTSAAASNEKTAPARRRLKVPEVVPLKSKVAPLDVRRR